MDRTDFSPWAEDIVTPDRIFDYEVEERWFALLGSDFQAFMQIELVGKNLTPQNL